MSLPRGVRSIAVVASVGFLCVLTIIWLPACDGAGDRTPPNVQLLYPSNGMVVTGTVEVAAEASDESNVDRVDFYIDSQCLFVDSDPPWRFEWNTSGLQEGSIHSVQAKASDAAGNIGASGVVSITIKAQPDTGTVELPSAYDVFVQQATPNANFNSGQYSVCLKLTPQGGFESEKRIFLRYDLSTVPASVQVISASLRFMDLSGQVNNSSDTVWFEARRILEYWDAGQVTWNSQPDYSSQSYGGGGLPGYEFDTAVSLDPSFVQSWLDGTATNYGVAVIPTGQGSYPNDYKTMPSYELSGLGIPLTVTYRRRALR